MNIRTPECVGRVKHRPRHPRSVHAAMTFPTRALHRALTVGIRREDATRIWERRAPLTPDAVYSLIAEKDVNVHVEHCDRRAFSDTEYIKVCCSLPPVHLLAHYNNRLVRLCTRTWMPRMSY